MKEFPSHICFKYTWRSYQQKVLDQLSQHLSDDKLHIVAPPGSGKTVLGLEVMLRLNKPTLILAPTLAVRNQWVERFCELFLQVDEVPDWISRDLYNPQFLTVSTYQGLHATFNNLKEEEEILEEEEIERTVSYGNRNGDTIIQLLKEVGISTIIVDEAHHLKKEWWKSLDFLEQKLAPTVVGLTATPPYDVAGFEWNRYISLNGPIDEEIFVPELIGQGDLCPHQDYIYFSMPELHEREAILEIRNNVHEIYTKLRQNEELIVDLEQTPVYQKPMEYLDWIYENLANYMACLVLINDFRGTVPSVHLEILGDEETTVPILTYEWMEKALNFYCFRGKIFFEEIEGYEERVEKIINRLRRYGAMEHRQIRFGNSKKENALLNASVNKLSSILDIVNFEHQCLQDQLRLVVLADYIRKEYHVQKEINDSTLSKVGVVSIFEHLRRNAPHITKLGVLTGSLVIIPISAKERLVTLMQERNIKEVAILPVAYDSSYIEISIREHFKNDVIHLITRLFEEGEIKVLVGTKALLGEGWDAPAINALILASVVGSYVSSNQMRGRAIRTERNNPTKTANIWHLVCLDPDVEHGGNDRNVLSRRFRGFVGISNHEEEEQVVISNGTQRLLLPYSLQSYEEIEEQNKRTFEQAKNREALYSRWNEGIAKGTDLVHTIKVPFIPSQDNRTLESVKAFYTRKTIANALFSLGVLIGTFLINQFYFLMLNVVIWGDMNKEGFLFWLFNTFFMGVFLKFGKKAYRNYKIARKYRDISLDVLNIATALLETLCKFELIATPKEEIEIISRIDVFGSIYCVVKGTTVLEGNLFVSCLNEILAPIDNPRYVIERRSFLAHADSYSDFHAVPECLGMNRKMVDYFAGRWAKYVGPTRIVYTRTPEGRSELLSCRVDALSNQLADNGIREENVWV